MHGSSLRRLWSLVSLIALFALAACGNAQSTPTAGTGGGTTTTTTTTTARAATTTAGGAATTAVATAARTTGATGAATAARTTGTTTRGGAAVSRPPEGPCTAQAAASARPPSGRQRLVIATGGTGGVFYPYGGGLARILTARLPNTEATAEVTGGSVDNLKLLARGDADLGLTTVDSADEALKGQGVYRDTGPIPACTIAVLYDSFIHVVALGDAGINSVADLRGKQVSVGSPGSSTEVAANRLLEAAGLNPQTDIRRETLSVAESANAMRDRRIQAFFWIGGLPTAAVTDLATTGNVPLKFLDTTPFLGTLTQRYGPVYTPSTLPANVYRGVPETPGIGVGNLLVVNANTSEQLVNDILRTIFDNLQEVQQIHPEARNLTLERAAGVSAIPFHPGAIRFYRERGDYR